MDYSKKYEVKKGCVGRKQELEGENSRIFTSIVYMYDILKNKEEFKIHHSFWEKNTFYFSFLPLPLLKSKPDRVHVNITISREAKCYPP